MPDKKPKKKIADHIETGRKVGEVVKDFTPDEVDVMIDRGVETAQAVNGIKKWLGSLFGKKRQL